MSGGPFIERAILVAAVCCCAALCLSCAESARGAMIAIDSDLCEPGDPGGTLDFTRVEVTVARADGTGTVETRCATFDPSDASGCEIIDGSAFPLLLPIQSASGEGTLQVTAELRDASGVVACAEGTLTMDPSEIRWGYLVVRRPCGTGGACDTDSVEAMDWASAADVPDTRTCTPALEQPREPIDRIAVGDAHACLVDADSNLFCWGDNDRGQLGLGPDRMDRPRPTRVQLGAGRFVRDVAAGRRHTCVLEDNAGSLSVRCFGDNEQGQLGNGMVGAPSGNPIIAGGTTGARGISLGPAHSCARMNDGSVVCWGSNAAGEASGTAGPPITSATAVPGVSDVLMVDAGGRNGEETSRHTCVAHGAGGVTCWGGNSHGQLGRDLAGGESPESITALETTRILQVALGGEETCASSMTGELFCWGRNEDPGTLGIELSGMGTRVTMPTDVTPGTMGVAPPAGTDPPRATLGGSELWRCFIGEDRRAYCLGNDLDGRLGGATAATATPTAVPAPGGITFQSVETGAAFACALPADGSMPVCWGNDSQGQLGDGPGGTGEPTQIPSCD